MKRKPGLEKKKNSFPRRHKRKGKTSKGNPSLPIKNIALETFVLDQPTISPCPNGR